MAPGSDYELWTTLAPLEGPTGRRQTRYTPYDDYYSSFSITDKCKNPEAAVRLADFMLTEEATLRNCNGVKDVNWRYVTEDLPSIDGGKAFKLSTGDTIQVTRAARDAQLVKLKEQSFFEVVNQKFGTDKRRFL